MSHNVELDCCPIYIYIFSWYLHMVIEERKNDESDIATRESSRHCVICKLVGVLICISRWALREWGGLPRLLPIFKVRWAFSRGWSMPISSNAKASKSSVMKVTHPCTILASKMSLIVTYVDYLYTAIEHSSKSIKVIKTHHNSLSMEVWYHP